MARSKAKKASQQNAIPASTNPDPRFPRPRSDTRPPKLFVLPHNRDRRSSFVTLLDPAALAARRYFLCPENGLYEIKEISYPKHQPRSWLIEPVPAEVLDTAGHTDDCGSDAVKKSTPPGYTFAESRQGWVLERSSLCVVTSVDPIFILLPILFPSATSTSRTSRSPPPSSHFLTLDDHFDSVIPDYCHYKLLLRYPAIRTVLEKRAAVICDEVEVGDVKLYRLNTRKLARDLLDKAKKMYGASGKLPTSLEDRFVRPALEPPMTVGDTEPETKDISALTSAVLPGETRSAEPPMPSLERDEWMASSSLQFSADISETTPLLESADPIPGQAEQIQTFSEMACLLRLRTALTFILHCYVPLALHAQLQTHFSDSASFVRLDAHISELADRRRAAAALQSVHSGNLYVHKRDCGDDGMDSFEKRAEKKRRLEKEEKEAKRRKGSKGLRDLKRADTSGMKKMSSFFGKR